MAKDNEMLFGLAESLGVEQGKAIHKYLMGKEIGTLANTITHLGETSNPKLDNESIKENADWNALLDRLFDEVADFARAHGYEDALDD